MPKSWELSRGFVSIELFRRSPRVVGSLEHDLPEVTRAVPEPHKESRHQHPQKSFDLLSEGVYASSPAPAERRCRRAPRHELRSRRQRRAARISPSSACFSRTKRGLDARVDERGRGGCARSFPGRASRAVATTSTEGNRGGVVRIHVSPKKKKNTRLDRSVGRVSRRARGAAARVVLDHIFFYCKTSID